MVVGLGALLAAGCGKDNTVAGADVVKGDKVAVEGGAICAPGGYQCVGPELQQCNPDAKAWSKLAACESAGLCQLGVTSGKCGTALCVAGTVHCTGAKLDRCKSDQSGYDDLEACLTPELCTAGIAKAKCPAVTCEPGERSCLGTGLRQCNAGRTGWDTIATCDTEALCKAGIQPGKCQVAACADTGNKCDGAVMTVCNPDRTALVTSTCETPTLCTTGLPGRSCLSKTCTPGARECSAGQLRVCKAGGDGWDTATCATPELCQASLPGTALTCVAPSCADSDNKCTGATMSACNQGRTQLVQSTCATPELCASGLAGKACTTATCAVGEKKCNGQTLQTCNAARNGWDTLTACANACVVGTLSCGGVCVPGAKQCKAGSQTPQLCDGNGVWEDQTACGGTTPVCLGAGTCVACAPSSKQCKEGARAPQLCDATGTWQDQTACTDFCTAGDCGATPPSCAGLTTQCQGESCCTSLQVPGGSFMMGRSLSGTDAFVNGSAQELPEHSVILSSFTLDRYEVTLGRFRRFLAAYDAWRAAGNPAVQAGRNGNVETSNPGALTGWQADWNSKLSATAAEVLTNMSSNPDCNVWTGTPGAYEATAMNCVDWFSAFAFCVWDGGRLPTEAEWEYTAAGGSENRLYPWGSAAPDASLASFGGSVNPKLPVGAKALGNGKWGHADLAGGMAEWNLDWYRDVWYQFAAPGSVNPVNLATQTDRLTRGGAWVVASTYIRAAYRSAIGPQYQYHTLGFRCAR